MNQVGNSKKLHVFSAFFACCGMVLGIKLRALHLLTLHFVEEPLLWSLARHIVKHLVGFSQWRLLSS